MKPLHQLKTFRMNSQDSLKALFRELTDLKMTTKEKKNPEKNLHHTKLILFWKRVAGQEAIDVLYLDFSRLWQCGTTCWLRKLGKH